MGERTSCGGYLDYAGDGRYELNPEQALVFVEETSPAYVMGGSQGMLAATRGYGASTMIMAEAFPESQFWRFDYHEPSIRHAQEAAAKAGLADRVMFEVGPGEGVPRH